ncbi:MAG: hypothetical protein WBA74_10080 [Cyclobacteriaceae bacterium]
MPQNSEQKIRELKKKIDELEEIIKKKQLVINYFQKIIEIAGKHLPFDLKEKLKKDGIIDRKNFE